MIVTIITLIIRGIKLSKTRRWCEQSLQIANAVLPFIREAENLTHFTGIEKKAFVMMKASQFAQANKMKLNETQVGTRVDELVDLTRKVNSEVNPKEIKEQIAKNTWL